MACDLRRSSGSTFGDRFGRYTQKWFKRRRQNLRRGALPLRRFASSVEAVEQRVMLSAISVTTFNDVVDANDGVLSLREAILQANAAEGADTINLQAGTYELAIVGFDDTGDAGDLDVLDDLSIFVSGGQATIDANGIDRVLHVIGSDDSGPAVTIRNVVLTGGEAERGAGLYNSLGTVTLIDGGITGNRASIEAPAYASDSGGLVSFVNSPLTNNAVGTTQDTALLDGIRDLIRANQADLIDGVDSVFDTLIDGLDTGLSRLELPLIGNQVREGLQPLFDGLEAFRTRTVDFINDVLTVSTADNAPPLQELLQTALFLALGPGDAGFSSLSPAVQAYLAPLRNQIQTLGLGILNDGADTGSSVGPGDILITLGQDGDGYRWLELGMHLGQRAVVDLPGFDLGLKSLASFIDNPASAAQLEAFLDTFGFSINSSTGLRVDARWDFRLAFGMSELPGQGFYLNAGATTNGLPDGTPIEELALGGSGTNVVVAPNAANVYATVGSTIVQLTRDATTGLLTVGGSLSVIAGATATDLAINSSGTDLIVATTLGLRRVSLSSGLLASVQAPSAAGATPVTGVAISGSTVYATFDGGIYRYSVVGGLFTYVTTYDVDNSTNRAEGESVAVSPDGIRVTSSFDTTSVNPTPSSRRIRLYSLKVVNEQGLDADGIDEVFVKVDGNTVYDSTQVDEGAFAPSFFASYDALYSGSIEIETWEDSLINEQIGGTYTVDAGKSPGIYTVNFIDEFADITVAEYQLKYEIYDVTSPTPVIQPIAYYTRDSNGGLSNRSYVSVTDVTQLETLTYSADGSYIYGTSFANDRVTIGTPTYVGYVGDGQTQSLTANVIGAPDDVRTVLSSDGQHAYSISAKFGVLATYGVNANGALSALPIQNIPLGLVAGSSLVMSSNGSQVYVTNPAEDSLFVFNRNASTGLLTLAQVLTDGLSGVNGLEGVTDIAASWDGNFIYAVGNGESSIAVFSRNSSTGALTFASTFSHADFDSPAAIKLTNAAGGQFAYVMNAGADSLIVLARDAATGALTYVQTVEDGVNGIDGLAGIAAVVLSPNEGYLYVAGSADDAVAIFRRDANSGMLTFVDRVTEGVAGIRGLDGVMQVAVSDEYLFAAGTVALVVFARDATTGKLTLLQRLRDGSSGIVGLERVTDLDLRSDGAVLYVSSGGRVAGDGGVASFDIVQMLPDPIVYDILQSGMEALTATTADGSDTVVVGRVNVPVLTINTNAETDAVTISEASGTTTINLGADGDYLNVLSAAAGAITTLNGDSGDDDLAVYATGAGATTTVNGGDGDDDIRVTGGRLASTVLVHGDSPNFGDTPAPNPGDTLIFDAHGQQTNPVTPLPSAGTVRIATRSFGVTYDTIENIVIIGSPLADAGGPYTITEGTSLKLDGTESLIPSGHANVSYVWSVGDASVLVSGPSQTLSWNELVALGIDDNGTCIVALTVRTELNGEVFEDIATATLTILNAAPTLSLSGASTAEAGSRYTLALSANDPGDDQIERWIINWGDGTVETYYSSGGVLQHMYNSTGTFAISVTAYDEDGGPYGPATKNLTVISSRSISGVATVNEGSPYTLSLNTPAGVAIAGWTIHWGDGSTQTVTGALSSVTHTYHDDGSYRIWASTIDVDGATRDQIGPLDVLVRNVSPTITSFAASQPILQGSSTTLTAVATDPGADEITFEFDLDGDSFFETTSSSGAFPHDFQKVGTYRIAVRAHDDDGGVSDIRYLAVTVQNVGPSIASIAILTSEPAESLPVRVQVNATDPGGDSDPLTYEFDFDNDGTYEVASGSPIGWHIYPENGDYTVSVRVTDSHGASAMGSIVVQVANLPPTYTAPYVRGRAEEGRPVILGVVASDPAGAYDPLTYQFDFDGDGHYDATSTTGEVVHTFADDGIYTVRIQISDDDGGVTETSLIVNVRNVAPTVALAGEDCIEEGRPFTLTLGAMTDPGADTVTRYIVNWGDGTSTEYTTDGSVTHVYSGTVGTRTITVFLVDEDGLHPLAGRHEVTVSGAVVRDGTLFVVGCHDDDLVTVNSTGNGVIRVHATFLPDGPYKDFSSSDIQRIVIYTNGGDDHVAIAGSITIPAIINGGAGDDHLNGGGGPTVLVGGDGDDHLIGSSAGDILIGGAGVDDLRGGSGEDLLIGGTTAYDSPMSKWTVFDRLLSEWASERSLAERMANIQAGSGPILSDSDGLRSSSSQDEEQTIFDDDDHDRLFGASDSDWLFVGVDDDAFAARGDLLTEML